MIYTIGIAIIFFLLLILSTKKQKSKADVVLLIWFSVIMLQLILFYVISTNTFLQFPYFLGVEIPLPLLHGPFLLIYITFLTKGNIVFRKLLFHFIPYTVALIGTLPFLFLQPEKKIYVYQHEGEGYTFLSMMIFLGIILSGIIYTFLSIRLLISYQRLIKNNYANTDKINLQWLYRLTIGLSCIWLFVFFADDKIIFTIVVFFVIFMGYYGVKQVGIFTNLPQQVILYPVEESAEESNLITTSSIIKYQKSALSDYRTQDIHTKLTNLMNEKKLFQTPELTLAMVAQELSIHPNSLSQVINAVEQKNFFDYVNTLRINEFKKLLAHPDNQKFTILSLAYDCGFNSKTSFNRNFKNLTGKSPSEYLKQNLKS